MKTPDHNSEDLDMEFVDSSDCMTCFVLFHKFTKEVCCKLQCTLKEVTEEFNYHGINHQIIMLCSIVLVFTFYVYIPFLSVNPTLGLEGVFFVTLIPLSSALIMSLLLLLKLHNYYIKAVVHSHCYLSAPDHQLIE